MPSFFHKFRRGLLWQVCIDFIINLYLPPNTNDKVYTTVIDALDYVLEFLERTDEIIIVRDFNLASVAWTASEDGHNFYHLKLKYDFV